VVNATDLLQYYAGVNTTSSLYDNVLSGRKWAVERAWKVLNHPTDPTLWPEFGAHSYVSEARYGFQYNHIIIGSGITQAPALYMGAPSYLMYGGIGYIAGHEVTHGFDANGRLWNNDRQYKDWWDDGSVEEFKNRSQCFIDQYSAIEAKDYLGEPVIGEDGKPAHVNGEQTLSENIADAGGLANAWVAWKKHEEKEPSKLLPGLDKFTKEQMFFIGMGQMFCSKFSQENMLEYVGKNGHAPPFARIRGATANSKAFKETWQCKKKEPECEIW
jgi:endothelin-converting enzyme